MKSYLFNKVIVVGVGLIGSSIGMNLVKKRLAREVIGVGRDRRNLKEALRRRAIHRFVVVGAARSEISPRPPLPNGGWGDLSEDDLVILATPVRSILGALRLLPKEVLVTDVGSTKASILREAARRKIRFVGSHPIAGTEKQGAVAGDMDLFQGRNCLVVPCRGSSGADVRKIRQLWKSLGCRTILMNPERHDKIFAVISHMPHAVSYALVTATSKLFPLQMQRFAGGSLGDTTRIAASSAEMWSDILLENRRNVLKALDAYFDALWRIREDLKKNRPDSLLKFLKAAQQIRLGFS